MINPKTKQRELAYVVKIDRIEPIIGSDNCESAVVGGWHIMTRKGTFEAGDYAVYFEIDSKVPATKEFDFLAKKHYKIKTQKYTFGGKGNFISQGLLMAFKDFCIDGFTPAWLTNIYWRIHSGQDVSNTFLTKELNVVYSVEEDNKRKSNIDKYMRMYQRHIKLFKKHKILRKIYQTSFGKKLLFIFLGKKRDKRGWPVWVSKTDEERIQNMPYLFPGDDTTWLITEKIDGSSTTFTMKRGIRKNEFYVCSRNVCFDKPEKIENCYYNSNIYMEMSEKYQMERVLTELLKKYSEWSTVTIQGETYGKDIQKRDYGLDGHDFMAFNLIFQKKGSQEKVRFNSIEMTKELEQYGIPCVPILSEDFKLPETVDEMVALADGKSYLDGGMREGIVVRTLDGKQSFKTVSNDFLIQYHQ